MNWFNRLLAILFALGLLVGGVFAVAAIGGHLRPSDFSTAPPLAHLVGNLQELDPRFAFWAPAGGVIGAILGLLLLWLELRVPRSGPEILIRRDKLGSVTVSLPGLRRLAEHVVSEIQGVESIVSEVWGTRDGVAFRCRVIVKPDTSAPELAEEIRQRLETAATHHLGRPVTRIHVHTRVGSLNSRRRVL